METVNKSLVSALLDSANPFAVERFTYDGFKAKYGKSIFGAFQPKRALDSVAEAMQAEGYQLSTGFQVKRDGLKGNGFTITPLEDAVLCTGP